MIGTKKQIVFAPFVVSNKTNQSASHTKVCTSVSPVVLSQPCFRQYLVTCEPFNRSNILLFSFFINGLPFFDCFQYNDILQSHWINFQRILVKHHHISKLADSKSTLSVFFKKLFCTPNGY